MLLLGDIGNTEIKICIFSSKKKLIKKVILKTNLISLNYLNIKLNFLKTKNYKIKKILFSSVVPNAFKIIKKYLFKQLTIKCIELKKLNLSKLIKIKVDKKQVGSDRIANAIAVINHKSNFIIIDFGTATTFDVVINNQYLGGIIAPGVSLSLKTLTKKASLIPDIKLAKTSNVIGTNTISAVRSGFFWGYSGLIDNIVKLIKKQTNRSFKIVLTGGLSHLFKTSINGNITIKKDLTISGLLKTIKT